MTDISHLDTSLPRWSHLRGFSPDQIRIIIWLADEYQYQSGQKIPPGGPGPGKYTHNRRIKKTQPQPQP